jgi:hypothetical protein
LWSRTVFTYCSGEVWVTARKFSWKLVRDIPASAASDSTETVESKFWWMRQSID